MLHQWCQSLIRTKFNCSHFVANITACTVFRVIQIFDAFKDTFIRVVRGWFRTNEPKKGKKTDL